MKTRAEALAVARSWKGTPYVLHGRVKGGGTDCAMLLASYLIEIGAVDPAALGDFGPYGPDWFHTASSERYLASLMRFGTLVAETMCRGGVEAQPGDLVLFKVARSRLFNHGAIVTAWPRGIHAGQHGVAEVDLVAHSLTGHKQIAIFDPWGVR